MIVLLLYNNELQQVLQRTIQKSQGDNHLQKMR